MNRLTEFLIRLVNYSVNCHEGLVKVIEEQNRLLNQEDEVIKELVKLNRQYSLSLIQILEQPHIHSLTFILYTAGYTYTDKASASFVGSISRRLAQFHNIWYSDFAQRHNSDLVILYDFRQITEHPNFLPELIEFARPHLVSTSGPPTPTVTRSEIATKMWLRQYKQSIL